MASHLLLLDFVAVQHFLDFRLAYFSGGTSRPNLQDFGSAVPACTQLPYRILLVSCELPLAEWLATAVLREASEGVPTRLRSHCISARACDI